MPNETVIDLNPACGVFPLTQLLKSGLWTAMSVNTKAVFPVLWDYHRRFPDACRPSRLRLATEAGISEPSVTKALKELESIGIVTVIPTPGPRTNTYRLKWQNLQVPEAKPSKQAEKSPYKLPSNPKLPEAVKYNEDGTGKLVWRRGNAQGYKLADGCWVRSAKEVLIHDYLRAWRVPHWCDVAYFDLGIPLRKKNGELDRQSSVDFVVGPNVLIEQAGLSKTQVEATLYCAKLDAKVEAAEKAGWTMIVIQPDKLPDDWLYDEIAESWARSTIEQAEKLMRRLDKAGWLNPNKKKNRRLLAHIKDAKMRLSGQKQPRKKSGLHEQKLDGQGFPVSVPLNPPKLCLMESALPTVPEAAIPCNLLDDFDLLADSIEDVSNQRPEERPPLAEEEKARVEAIRGEIENLEDRIESGDLTENAKEEAHFEVYQLQGELAALEDY